MKTWKKPLYKKGQLVRIKGTQTEGVVTYCDIGIWPYRYNINTMGFEDIEEKKLERVTHFITDSDSTFRNPIPDDGQY